MSFLKQITVFGGTGFIGRYVVQRLAKEGLTIRVPTRDTENALSLKPAGNVGQIIPIGCSTKSDSAVAKAIGPSQAVINLLGILFERGRNTFRSVHVETAARIARIAKEQGAHNFVHVSAISADSSSKSKYAQSKAAGEMAVQTFFPEAIIFRPSLVFGAEDNFFNLFASLARFLPFLPLIGGGATRFQPVFVGDVADAITKTLSQTEARGQIYELGGPQIYSFRALLELILLETNRRRSFINLPWPLAKLHAGLHELLPLPRPLITRDQVEMLKTDAVIHPHTKTLYDLGINPTALELILPLYLKRFRAGGDLSVLEQTL